MLMRRIAIAVLLMGLGLPAVFAQSGADVPVGFTLKTAPGKTQTLTPVPSIRSNFVANLHAEGDSLWVGPRLNLTTNGGTSWLMAEADSVSNGRGRVFSIDAEGRTIWAGLGYDERTVSGGSVEFVATALGFVFSEDGGATWTYRFPPLDIPGDTTEVYGISTLSALDVIVPQQSPPFDIDYDPASGIVWTAGWASGIRRSFNKGLIWERVVLPPDSLTELRPDRRYNFVYSPRQNQGPNSQSFNFSGFAVLVDETGTVWAGSAGGINRTLDGDAEFPTWRRYAFDRTPKGLIGNWVISIEEQPLPGRNAVWFTNWPANDPEEDFGVMVTRDGGETLEQVLIGEKMYDFAFRGETVYAAGDNGVFISEDGGATWRTETYFVDPNRPDRPVRRDIQVFAIAVTPEALWAGTNDGLFKSTDDGNTWQLFRSEVPLNPDTPSNDTPNVDAFAYPNPYAPSGDGFLRIRYALDAAQPVTIRIFDFGMQLLRTLSTADQPAGIREQAWDGTDDRGIRVANGTYFYAIQAGGNTTWGTILVVD